jgi:hypothetical protein
MWVHPTRACECTAVPPITSVAARQIAPILEGFIIYLVRLAHRVGAKALRFQRWLLRPEYSVPRKTETEYNCWRGRWSNRHYKLYADANASAKTHEIFRKDRLVGWEMVAMKDGSVNCH